MIKTRITRKPRKEGAPQRALRLSPDERHEQLLACAIKVFAAQGLATANHAMVAAAAQVSVPTVFFYFKTREALVDAVLSDVERHSLAIFAAAENAQQPADRTLMELGQTLTRLLNTPQADYVRIMNEWSTSMRSDIWPRYLRLYKRLVGVFAKVIERGQLEGSLRSDVDPKDEAVILYATSTALFQMKETGATAEQLDRLQRTVVQTVLAPPKARARSSAPSRVKPREPAL